MEQVWWGGKNVTELKMELRNRGLATTGKKADLVSRLENDDSQLRREEDKKAGIIRIFAKSMMGTIYEIKIGPDSNLTTLKTDIAERLGGKSDNIVLKYPVTDDSREIGDLYYGDYTYRNMSEESLDKYGLCQHMTILFSVRMIPKK